MIGPGFTGALDDNMLSIYTANTIWKLPDIFEPFCGLFLTLRCRLGQIDIFHSSANSLANFCYNLTVSNPTLKLCPIVEKLSPVARNKHC